MNNPEIAVAPPPKPKSARVSRTQKLINVGVAPDPEEARKRIINDRLRRRPKKAQRTVSFRADACVIEAIEVMADRYECSANAIYKRALQDVIKAYGESEEVEHAGLGEKKRPNPFDPLTAQPPSPSIYDTYRRGTPEGAAYMDEVQTRPNVRAILQAGGVPLPGAYDTQPGSGE